MSTTTTTTVHTTWCDENAHVQDDARQCSTSDRLTGSVAVFAFAEPDGPVGVAVDVSTGRSTFTPAQARDLAAHLVDLADLLDGGRAQQPA